MASVCIFCEDSGYLDINEYCSCDAGNFYEGRDEIVLQIQEGILDVGLDDIEYDPDYGYDYDWSMMAEAYEEYENMKLFEDLPFAYNDN